jgi:protein-disulfide isomerase
VPLSIAALVVGGILVVLIALATGVMDQPASRAVTMPGPTIPPGLADGRTLGSAAAPITIEVWEDFQCPVCGVFSRATEPRLIEEYVVRGKVRLVYRDMAFLGQESIDAAVAARAADQLGGLFWPYQALLFQNQHGENQGTFSRDYLADMAVALGLDRAAFLAALDDPALANAVRAETQQGTEQGVNSTPTLVVNGVKAAGLPDWAGLSGYLDSLLAGATPGSGT